MDKKKLLVLVILTVFCVGMCLGSVSATKTTSVPTKMNKYVNKHKWGYKLQSYKFKTGLYQQVCLFVYKKNGNMLKNSKYAMKVHYKRNGKWRYTHWVRSCISATYNNVKLEKSDKIGRVYVKVY